MKKTLSKVALATLGAGFALGVTFCLGFASGTGVEALNGSTQNETSISSSEIEKMILEAGTASSGEKIAITTGQIDVDVEGIFILDKMTGDLFCYVVDRLNKNPLAGRFKTNISGMFGPINQGSDLLLSTGFIRYNRGAGVNRPAECICYVADGSSGRVVGYSLNWNKNAAQAGSGQEGVLVTRFNQQIRQIAVRE